MHIGAICACGVGEGVVVEETVEEEFGCGVDGVIDITDGHPSPMIIRDTRHELTPAQQNYIK